MALKNKAQERLPGTEGEIPELEQLGHEYAALRDSRMELLKKEVELKKKTLEAMHKINLTTYKYQDIEMEIVPGKEKLQVKVEKDPESAEDAA
jgi:hypothetical protein